MEHEVFVPFPAERLRRALADPARVARAVPGLQQDAGAEPVTGRLKLRIGSHSITYRGSVRVTAQDDGAYAIEGDATESRGSGAAKLALTVRVRDTDGGTTLAFAGTASADGRVTELPQDAVTSAVLRLLDRFAEHLGEAAGGEPTAPTAPPAPETQETPETPGSVATEHLEPTATGDSGAAPDAEDAPVPAEPGEAAADDARPAAEQAPGDDARASVFDAQVPPPSLDPEADDEDDDESDDAVTAAPIDGEGIAEAAHARRTMIGRSAEEVDHAPPRGRYAPVPGPQSVAAQTPLRWAAPAAAVVLASAILVGRVLRRRR
ncbi:SRPBCC domain-containing protein [Streptomyces sp. DH24]|uniref:SRPBCC domain-containing protein n=1 Tax=Streptomyces sp. DH24 TaxID=3040123 RepID=UPI0024412448|nr:SRPBCC domain-containing protein [Streptomyces sp. DH24]MDG9720539.1 SRPBCC domain-containing protein [Streptomyces sp. DH24]